MKGIINWNKKKLSHCFCSQNIHFLGPPKFPSMPSYTVTHQKKSVAINPERAKDFSSLPSAFPRAYSVLCHFHKLHSLGETLFFKNSSWRSAHTIFIQLALLACLRCVCGRGEKSKSSYMNCQWVLRELWACEARSLNNNIPDINILTPCETRQRREKIHSILLSLTFLSSSKSFPLSATFAFLKVLINSRQQAATELAHGR